MSSAPALTLLLLAAACVQRQEVVARGDSIGEAMAADGPAVTLERTPCFGGCPVYRVSVTPGGLVSYQGKANVRHLGAATKQIPPERVRALLSELERAGYFSFATRYTPAEAACGRYATDSPAAITYVRLGDRANRVEHDYGCGSAPGALTVLERRIDEVLGSSQWTGR